MANQDIRNWLQPGLAPTIEAPPPKRQRVEQDAEGDVEEDMTNARIYVWTLDRIDPRLGLDLSVGHLFSVKI